MSPHAARDRGRWCAAAAIAGLAAAASAGAAHEADVDPVGVWSCLLYGESGDQRFYLALADDGGARIARPAESKDGEWQPLGAWRRTRDRIELDDGLNGRLFVASAAGADLGGTWLGIGDRGGWWCAATAYAVDDEPPAVAGLLPVLMPAVMASPRYPLSAIREAKEGRTVSCFIVTGAGEIERPAIVETTDDLFRGPTLDAVAASSYRSWGDDDATLPACRSFTFELAAGG
ncbi:MAG TPA: hypothetical protein VF339_10800 [Gammaproteobacteria bacterium]